jgi:hypothetical protein
MAKALVALGAVAITLVLAAYRVQPMIAIALPLLVVLGLVWWLTDPRVAVGRARGRTWFDRTSSSVGGWREADEVAAAPVALGPPTAQVAIKGARRADPRKV